MYVYGNLFLVLGLTYAQTLSYKHENTNTGTGLTMAGSQFYAELWSRVGFTCINACLSNPRIEHGLQVNGAMSNPGVGHGPIYLHECMLV